MSERKLKTNGEKGFRVQYRYTEDEDKASKKIKLGKEIKGGAKQSVEDGKEMFRAALCSDFSGAFGDTGDANSEDGIEYNNDSEEDVQKQNA